MSKTRNLPPLIFEYTSPKTYKTKQVYEYYGVYAVTYNGKPIGVRTFNGLLNYPDQVFEYSRTCFPSPAHAKNLARKLNKQFKTNGFEVKELIPGRTIPLDDHVHATAKKE